MASEGILVVIININMEERKLLARPMVTTRGFILINENEELIQKIEDISESSVIKGLENKKNSYADLKQEITKELINFIKEETGRKPIVLPIILNIKK